MCVFVGWNSCRKFDDQTPVETVPVGCFPNSRDGWCCFIRQ